MKFQSPQDSDHSTVRPQSSSYLVATPVNANEYERIIYHKAIELLARRDHSELELRQKLKALKQQPQEGVAVEHLLTQVIHKVQQQGLQNDERFAEAYCRSRLRKGFGGQRICMELAQKGIEKSLAEHALGASATQELAADAVIYNAWQKKFRLPPGDTKERIKQQRFLLYRGFSQDAIKALFEGLN